MLATIGPGERHFLSRIAKMPSPVVFDVGANVCSYATELKRLCPTARIWAFEPHPVTFEQLASQAARYEITALNVGLSDHSRKARLFDYAAGSGSPHASLHKRVIEVLHASESTELDIELTTIDAVLSSGEPRHVDLLKIDAEGHELAVIKGASKAIADGAIDLIQFEFNEMNVISRVFLRDFYDALPSYEFYRMVVDGLAPLGTYRARTHELFFLHNIVAIRKGVTDAQALLGVR